LHFYEQFFWSLLRSTWGAPSSLPLCVHSSNWTCIWTRFNKTNPKTNWNNVNGIIGCAEYRVSKNGFEYCIKITYLQHSLRYLYSSVTFSVMKNQLKLSFQ
jgi:hypothetical protein